MTRREEALQILHRFFKQWQAAANPMLTDQEAEASWKRLEETREQILQLMGVDDD